MARGNQVVIVGDPEQLPPTNVGERGAEDDDETLAELPSVLDECLGANIPRIALSWHYRSCHESLIAFSNAKYYRGNLVTFPSPLTRDTAVNYVHVPDGVYERGTGRVNRRAAATLVADVARKLKSSPHSTGVVTFDAKQQRLIENLLDQQRLADRSLEPHFDTAKSSESVFVKNLENVHGDERDVILFSVAGGPDTAGVIRAQISSLNREGGHRRLNVAVTRAGRELSVFATLKPAQIDLEHVR
jgi:superfamily I DNA and/or RNA helicase